MASLVSDRHDFLKLQLEAEYLLPLTLERIHSSFAALREAEYRREAQEDERRRQERQARRPDKDLAITVAPQPRGPGTVVDLRDPRDPVAEARLAERMKKAAVEAEKRWAENKKKQDDELKRMQIDNYLSGRHPWSPAW